MIKGRSDASLSRLRRHLLSIFITEEQEVNQPENHFRIVLQSFSLLDVFLGDS